jgi:lysophospholipase L1-like esterase
MTPTTTSTTTPTISPARRRVFILITIALPFIALAVVEIALRLFGFGGYPPFIRSVGTLTQGEQLCIVEPAASKPYFFANPTRPGYAEQSSFIMPKPKDTLRIFIIGESAAKGYPQPRNLAMSEFLQTMLGDILPQKRVEVINLGTTAVASFPLVYQVQDALRYQPDWFVFYVGNNEFFGAYGTASINAAGTMPLWALKLMRATRGLALVQAVESVVRAGADENRTLMEQMIGQTFIACDSPLREAAARNLQANLGDMVDQVKAAGVAALVCTTASNESGLAPLGQDDVSNLSGASLEEFNELLRQAAACSSAQSVQAVELLGKAALLAPRSALTQFMLANAQANAGDLVAARKAFLLARDLDTMPWRPISVTEQAIRETAAARGVLLCDIAFKFRNMSARGATDWELLDDHVHPSLQGQVQAARAMAQDVALAIANTNALVNTTANATTNAPVNATTNATTNATANATAPTPIPAQPGASITSLNDPFNWNSYAQRLGSNPFDTYRVNHTLRTLFGIGFMKNNNKQAFDRYESACKNFESTLSPSMLEAAREWQTSKPHAGGMRPLTGMEARVFLRENKTEQALALYQIAQTQVPNYTSWKLEYIYFTLACQERLAQQQFKDATALVNTQITSATAPASTQGNPTATALTNTQITSATAPANTQANINAAPANFLTESQMQQAADGIAEGNFLLRQGFSESGFTERYVGRLHQLRGEWAQAISYLLAARPRMAAEDLVACDQALFMSYIKTGNTAAALQLANEGIEKSGRFAPVYQQLRSQLGQR